MIFVLVQIISISHLAHQVDDVSAVIAQLNLEDFIVILENTSRLNVLV